MATTSHGITLVNEYLLIFHTGTMMAENAGWKFIETTIKKNMLIKNNYM